MCWDIHVRWQVSRILWRLLPQGTSWRCSFKFNKHTDKVKWNSILCAPIKSQPRKRVAVAQAADAHVLQAISEGWKEGYVTPILVGSRERITAVAQECGIDITPFEIVDTADEDVASEAVSMVRSGKADVVMKGLMESAPFLRAVLNRESGLAKPGTTVSAVAMVELKKLNRLIFITDPGISPAPDLAQKVSILKNAVEVVRQFGADVPKVAAISAAETLNKNMVSSVEAAALAQLCRDGTLEHCQVAGPISVDLALSAEAAEEKGYHNPVAGSADILLVPTVEVGNGIYKSLMLFAEMDTGGIIAGTTAPVVFCSRADSAQTKKNTLALAVYMAAKKE